MKGKKKIGWEEVKKLEEKGVKKKERKREKK